MQARLNSLLEVVDDSDRMELVMLNNAFVEATNNYKVESTSEAVKEWRKLKEDLSSLLDELEEKYDMNVEAPDTFGSKIKVWEYLVAGGWKISKTQFYQHCKDGLLRPTKKTGKYTLKAVEKYAKLHVPRAESGQKANEKLDAMQERKLEVELEREEVRLEKDRHELAARQGKYVRREEFELAIVGRAVAFMAHLNHTIQQEVGNWIDIAGGDQTRAPELVDAISRAVEQRMGDFAVDAEFDVILEGN